LTRVSVVLPRVNVALTRVFIAWPCGKTTLTGGKFALSRGEMARAGFGATSAAAVRVAGGGFPGRDAD
jgi:hypothetical protein